MLLPHERIAPVILGMVLAGAMRLIWSRVSAKHREKPGR